MISIFDKTEPRVEERVLPAPDLFASCPNDGSVRTYYAGQFEAVYVLLHPFIKPVILDRERFCPKTYPSKTEIVSCCQAITWEEVTVIMDFANISEVDIGLRTGIMGLKKELANEKLAGSINRLDEEYNIIQPTEGDVSELLQNDLFAAFQRLGHRWLWIGDDACTERQLVWIEDLKGDYQLPAHCNMFTPDKSLLLTTHWDSHFSFLCSEKRTIERILEYKNFEGFFCEEDTEVYWSIGKG